MSKDYRYLIIYNMSHDGTFPIAAYGELSVARKMVEEFKEADTFNDPDYRFQIIDMYKLSELQKVTKREYFLLPWGKAEIKPEETEESELITEESCNEKPLWLQDDEDCR